MLNKHIDNPNRDAVEGQRQRLEALRDLFEEDRGRRPATIKELRDWMGAQCLDQLQNRMSHRLLRAIQDSPSLAPEQRRRHPALQARDDQFEGVRQTG